MFYKKEGKMNYLDCTRLVFLLAVLISPLLSCAEQQAEVLKEIKLPSPRMEGGRPLMEVLKDRRTIRSYSGKELSNQELSNLLWAAFGVNRPGEGKRTAPTAMNMQEIDIYVAKKDGLFLYDAKKNVLYKLLNEDIRSATGRQAFITDAPINLVFVTDYSRMGSIKQESKDFYSATDTGFISQNVYLYCASEGLATVIRGSLDKKKLHKVMKLKRSQKVILAQTVGYPG
jgi:SagB-type dehydrogenase family enzyme